MTVAMAPRSETRLLVSVRNAAEARLAQASGPYLIDAKDPGRGALGALPAAEIVAIIASVRALSEEAATASASFGSHCFVLAPCLRTSWFRPHPARSRLRADLPLKGEVMHGGGGRSPLPRGRGRPEGPGEGGAATGDMVAKPWGTKFTSSPMVPLPQTSAVAGEPENFEDLVERVRAVVATGVDLVKVALPPDMLGILPGDLAKPVIAVLFAEDGPDATWLPRIAAAGFRGAMIDTRVKDGTGLLDRMSLERLAEFVRTSRAHDLMTGLAGSLQLADIPALAALRPDYLGFRGGLCRSGQRRGELDPDRMRQAWRALGDALRVPAQA